MTRGGIWPRYHRRLLGLAGVAVIGLSVFLVYASYTEMFVPDVPVRVVADRSGLLLDDKADVTLRGIKVGEVRGVNAESGQAVIDLAIDTRPCRSCSPISPRPARCCASTCPTSSRCW